MNKPREDAVRRLNRLEAAETSDWAGDVARRRAPPKPGKALADKFAAKKKRKK